MREERMREKEEGGRRRKGRAFSGDRKTQFQWNKNCAVTFWTGCFANMEPLGSKWISAVFWSGMKSLVHCTWRCFKRKGYSRFSLDVSLRRQKSCAIISRRYDCAEMRLSVMPHSGRLSACPCAEDFEWGI